MPCRRVLSGESRIEYACSRTPRDDRGGAVTEEIHPGFHCSTLAHATGPFSPKII